MWCSIETIGYLHLRSTSLRYKFASLVVLDLNRLQPNSCDSAGTRKSTLLLYIKSFTCKLICVNTCFYCFSLFLFCFDSLSASTFTCVFPLEIFRFCKTALIIVTISKSRYYFFLTSEHARVHISKNLKFCSGNMSIER